MVLQGIAVVMLSYLLLYCCGVAMVLLWYGYVVAMLLYCIDMILL